MLNMAEPPDPLEWSEEPEMAVLRSRSGQDLYTDGQALYYYDPGSWCYYETSWSRAASDNDDVELQPLLTAETLDCLPSIEVS